MIRHKVTRRTVAKMLRDDSGVKIGFADILWFDNGEFLRHRTAGNGKGERVKINAIQAIRLIKNNYGP